MLLVRRNTSEMTRLSVTDDSEMEQKLNERNGVEDERGPLHRREGVQQIKGGRIRTLRDGDLAAGVVLFPVVVVVGVLASDFRRQIFEQK